VPEVRKMIPVPQHALLFKRVHACSQVPTDVPLKEKGPLRHLLQISMRRQNVPHPLLLVMARDNPGVELFTIKDRFLLACISIEKRGIR
jgi:hypothetical protein